MKSQILIITFMSIFLGACVQSRTMVKHRVTDNAMGCEETAVRIGELNAIKSLTLKEKNSKNILAGLLFFPAVSGNQTNTRDTINAVNARKSVLADHYQANECVSSIPVFSTEQIKQMIANNQVKELQG